MTTYDLLLKGGLVVDPAQELHGVADVAVKGERVAAVAPELPVAEAGRVIDVAGKVVTPGLIDLHTHVYWGGTPLGIKVDLVCPESGVTTFVDAGSAGPANFLGFKEQIVDQSRARIFAFLHIAWMGLVGAAYLPEEFAVLGESFDVRYDMVRPAVEVGQAFPDLIRGIKVRVGLESSGDQGMRPVWNALEAADILSLPAMVHINAGPPTRQEVLSALRPGDILTHVYRGAPNSPLDGRGKVLPGMWEARERGVFFDIGHGGSSFSWPIARAMLEQGFSPDTISSDIHLGSKIHTTWPGMPAMNQPTTMSKMLSLGMSLDDVVRAATWTPASILGCQEELGHLRPGALADVAVFDLQEGQFEYTDSFSGTSVGNRRLAPVLTVLGGQVLARTEQGAA
jgi:dihydroorotase